MRKTEQEHKKDSRELLSFLLSQGNRYVSKSEICSALPNTFIANTSKDSHDLCTYIWTCKNYVNTHIEDFGKIIISNSVGDLKIPTKQEIEKSLEKEEFVKARQWKRLWMKKKALGLDGQQTLNGYVYNIFSKETTI